MTVELRYFTDPACPRSWGSEPKLRRLLWEFDGELRVRFVMAGLAREYGPSYRDPQSGIGVRGDPLFDLMAHWLDVCAEAEMPCDPRVWHDGHISSTYPACQAAKAAQEQGPESAHRYLRRLREGILVEGKKLDHFAALVGEAAAAGLDTQRFENDLASHAITEAFGADLDETRTVAAETPDEMAKSGNSRERPRLPGAVFIGQDGERLGLWGWQPYEAYRDAARAAGANQPNEGPLDPLAAVERYGRIATKEAEVLAGRPRPIVEAELWALARDWKLRPVPVLTGVLWEKP